MIEIILVAQLFAPNIQLTPGVAHNIKIENLCPVTQLLRIDGVEPIVRDKILVRYGYFGNGREYHIDILVPLELGGEVVLGNLWPIPYKTRRDTLVQKVALEHKLHELVCNGSITLEQAQLEFIDWIDAYDRYFSDKRIIRRKK